jgi:4,5-dihydroxyphthalate decarboxylase
METLRLTAALSDYDHVRDLVTGAVRPQGITVLPLTLRPHEIFYRFMTHHEWEVSEMSFGGYCSMVADGDDSAIAIPVFPSRVFRHSSIYIRNDGPVRRPEDLAGKRIGVAEWGMTAVIYIRGWMMHQIGISLQDVDWVQGGTSEPGRTEKISPALPAGVRLAQVTDRSLSDMLLAGDIDAILCAAPPAPFRAGDPRMVRLFPESRPAEEAYFRETGVYPIMHVIAIRSDVYRQNRWVALSLYHAFEEAKNRSVARVMTPGSPVPIPWSFEETRRAARLMFPDGDYWPYGVDANRATLDAFLAFCHEQGVTRRRLMPADLFAPETLSLARE